MSECMFCHGGPVGNAASWLDDKPRPPAACPRCGEVNWPEITLDEAIHAARSIAKAGDAVEREYFRSLLVAYMDQRMNVALEDAFSVPAHGEQGRT